MFLDMLDVILKSVIVYFFILIILRFMGKREVGQLSLFDFVILLVIADIAVIGIEEKNRNILIFLIPILILAIIQKVLAFITLKIAFLRDMIDGKQSIIVLDGKLNIREMRKQNYNVDDLVIQLRLKNINSISEVRYVILETNGEISVFKHEEFARTNTNVNKDISDSVSGGSTNIVTSGMSSNMKQKMALDSKIIYPFPLITSGKVKKDNLKILAIEEKWLLEQINKKGYSQYKDVIYANYENGGLFIAETCEF